MGSTRKPALPEVTRTDMHDYRSNDHLGPITLNMMGFAGVVSAGRPVAWKTPLSEAGCWLESIRAPPAQL